MATPGISTTDVKPPPPAAEPCQAGVTLEPIAREEVALYNPSVPEAVCSVPAAPSKPYPYDYFLQPHKVVKMDLIRSIQSFHDVVSSSQGQLDQLNYEIEMAQSSIYHLKNSPNTFGNRFLSATLGFGLAVPIVKEGGALAVTRLPLLDGAYVFFQRNLAMQNMMIANAMCQTPEQWAKAKPLLNKASRKVLFWGGVAGVGMGLTHALNKYVFVDSPEKGALDLSQIQVPHFPTREELLKFSPRELIDLQNKLSDEQSAVTYKKNILITAREMLYQQILALNGYQGNASGSDLDSKAQQIINDALNKSEELWTESGTYAGFGVGTTAAEVFYKVAAARLRLPSQTALHQLEEKSYQDAKKIMIDKGLLKCPKTEAAPEAKVAEAATAETTSKFVSYERSPVSADEVLQYRYASQGVEVVAPQMSEAEITQLAREYVRHHPELLQLSPSDPFYPYAQQISAIAHGEMLGLSESLALYTGTGLMTVGTGGVVAEALGLVEFVGVGDAAIVYASSAAEAATEATVTAQAVETTGASVEWGLNYAFGF